MAILLLSFTSVFSQTPVVNLIDNGGFENLDCDDEILQSVCDFYFNGISDPCVLPWGNVSGTSAILDLDGPGSVCVSSGHGPEIGRYFAQVHSKNLPDLDGCQREAFYTQLSSPCDLKPGQEYSLSFQARTNNVQFEVFTNPDHPNEISDFWIYVASVQGLVNEVGGLFDDLECSAAQSTELGRQIIYSEQAFNTDDEWETISFTFTPPAGFVNDQIMFWGQYGSDDTDHNWRNIFFDNFVLTCESQFTAEYDYDQTGTLSFAFTGDIEAAISGLEVTDWYWDFGDCLGTSTLQNPSYTYMFPGTYEVCLTITDNRCCTKTVCFPVTTGAMEMVDVDVVCYDVCFTTETTPESALWDFGDGQTSTEIQPCHTYDEAGTYEVTVTYTNGDCDYVEEIEVVVTYCGGSDYCEDFGEQTPDIVIGTDPCSETNASAIWPGTNPTTITGDKILINGTLYINKWIDFVDCIVEMGPHAEIVVLTDQRLDVASTNIYSCEYLWRRIRVMGRGNLILRSKTPISAPTTIASAWAGVFAHTRANLDISNTVFDCNMIGVYIPPVPTIPDSPTPTSLPNMVNIFKFDNIRFVGSELLPPYSTTCSPGSTAGSNFFTVTPLVASYTGVLMYDVHEIDLSANSMSTSNIYINMRSGIVAERSSFNVENSRFMDLNPLAGSGYPRNGFGIHALGNGSSLTQRGFGKDQVHTFKNVRTGIQVQDYNVLIEDNNMVEGGFVGISAQECRDHNIKIRNNSINYSKAGIDLIHNDPVKKMEVLNNTIEMDHNIGSTSTHSGIRVTEMQMPPVDQTLLQGNEIYDQGAWYGMLIAASKNTKLENNFVYPGSENNFDGISIRFSPNSMVRKNSIEGIGTGGSGIENRGIRIVESTSSWLLCNDVQNLRQGIYFDGESPASTVARNEFVDNLAQGLYYEDGARTGQQNNTQNLWCGNTTISGGFEAFHVDDEFYHNLYRINTSDGECVDPDPRFPTLGWFVHNPIPEVQACSLYVQDEFRMPDSFDLLIATDQITSPENAPAYVWNARNALYRHLKNWPATEWDSTVFEDFLAEMDTSEVGIWYNVEQDIYQYLRPDSAYLDFYNGYQDTLSSAWAAIEQFGTDLIEATNSLDSLQAIASMDSMLLLLDGYAPHWNTTLYLHDSLYRTGLWTLGTQVNGLTTSNDWTGSLKTVWRAYLRWLWEETDSIPSSMVDDLETIASYCSQTHGFAVNLAFSLLHVVGDDNYQHPDCYTSSKPSSNFEALLIKKPDIHIYPNPAMDQVTVQLDFAKPEGEIVIYHISGSVVHQQKITEELTSLSTRHLTDGMYIVQWVSRNGERISKPLVIQH